MANIKDSKAKPQTRRSPKGNETSREPKKFVFAERKSSIPSKKIEAKQDCTKKIFFSPKEKDHIQACPFSLQKEKLKKITASSSRNSNRKINEKNCAKNLYTLELPDETNYNKIFTFLEDLKNTIEVPLLTSRIPENTRKITLVQPNSGKEPDFNCISQSNFQYNKMEGSKNLLLKKNTRVECQFIERNSKGLVQKEKNKTIVEIYKPTAEIKHHKQPVQFKQKDHKSKINNFMKQSDANIIEIKDKDNELNDLNISLVREQMNIKKFEEVSLLPLLTTGPSNEKLKFSISEIEILEPNIPLTQFK